MRTLTFELKCHTAVVLSIPLLPLSEHPNVDTKTAVSCPTAMETWVTDTVQLVSVQNKHTDQFYVLS